MKQSIEITYPLNVDSIDSTSKKYEFMENHQLAHSGILENSLTYFKKGFSYEGDTVTAKYVNDGLDYEDTFSTDEGKESIRVYSVGNDVFTVKGTLPDGTPYKYSIQLPKDPVSTRFPIQSYTRSGDIVTITCLDTNNKTVTLSYNQATGQGISSNKQYVIQKMAAYISIQLGDILRSLLTLHTKFPTSSSPLLILSWKAYRHEDEYDLSVDNVSIDNLVLGSSYPSWMTNPDWNPATRKLGFVNDYPIEYKFLMQATTYPLVVNGMSFVSINEGYDAQGTLVGTGWPDGRDGLWRPRLITPEVFAYDRLIYKKFEYLEAERKWVVGEGSYNVGNPSIDYHPTQRTYSSSDPSIVAAWYPDGFQVTIPEDKLPTEFPFGTDYRKGKLLANITESYLGTGSFPLASSSNKWTLAVPPLLAYLTDLSYDVLYSKSYPDDPSQAVKANGLDLQMWLYRISDWRGLIIANKQFPGSLTRKLDCKIRDASSPALGSNDAKYLIPESEGDPSDEYTLIGISGAGAKVYISFDLIDDPNYVPPNPLPDPVPPVPKVYKMKKLEWQDHGRGYEDDIGKTINVAIKDKPFPFVINSVLKDLPDRLVDEEWFNDGSTVRRNWEYNERAFLIVFQLGGKLETLVRFTYKMKGLSADPFPIKPFLTPAQGKQSFFIKDKPEYQLSLRDTTVDIRNLPDELNNVTVGDLNIGTLAIKEYFGMPIFEEMEKSVEGKAIYLYPLQSTYAEHKRVIYQKTKYRVVVCTLEENTWSTNELLVETVSQKSNAGILSNVPTINVYGFPQRAIEFTVYLNAVYPMAIAYKDITTPAGYLPIQQKPVVTKGALGEEGQTVIITVGDFIVAQYLILMDTIELPFTLSLKGRDTNIDLNPTLSSVFAYNNTNRTYKYTLTSIFKNGSHYFNYEIVNNSGVWTDSITGKSQTLNIQDLDYDLNVDDKELTISFKEKSSYTLELPKVIKNRTNLFKDEDVSSLELIYNESIEVAMDTFNARVDLKTNNVTTDLVGYEGVYKNNAIQIFSSNYTNILMPYVGIFDVTGNISHGSGVQTLSGSRLSFLTNLGSVSFSINFTNRLTLLLNKYDNYGSKETKPVLESINESLIRFKRFPDDEQFVNYADLYYINEEWAVNLTDVVTVVHKENENNTVTSCNGEWSIFRTYYHKEEFLKHVITSSAYAAQAKEVLIQQQDDKLIIKFRSAISCVYQDIEPPEDVEVEDFNVVEVPIIIGEHTPLAIVANKEEIYSIDFKNESQLRTCNCIVINNRLFIGIRINNQTLQWVLVIDTDTKALKKVVKGFSYIGFDGTLTGSVYPRSFLSDDGLYVNAEPVNGYSPLSDTYDNIDYFNEPHYFVSGENNVFAINDDELILYGSYNTTTDEVQWVTSNLKVSVSSASKAESEGSWEFEVEKPYLVDVSEGVKDYLTEYEEKASLLLEFYMVIQAANTVYMAAMAAADIQFGVSNNPKGGIQAAVIGLVNATIAGLCSPLLNSILNIVKKLNWKLPSIKWRAEFNTKSYAMGYLIANRYKTTDYALPNYSELGGLSVKVEHKVSVDAIKSSLGEFIRYDKWLGATENDTSLISKMLMQSKWTSTEQVHNESIGSSAKASVELSLEHYYYIGASSSIHATPGTIEFNAYQIFSCPFSHEHNENHYVLEGLFDVGKLYPTISVPIPIPQVTMSGMTVDTSIYPPVALPFGDWLAAKELTNDVKPYTVNAANLNNYGYNHVNLMYPCASHYNIDIPSLAIGCRFLDHSPLTEDSYTGEYLELFDDSSSIPVVTNIAYVFGLTSLIFKGYTIASSLMYDYAINKAKILLDPVTPASITTPAHSYNFEINNLLNQVSIGNAIVGMGHKDTLLFDGQYNNILLDDILVAGDNILVAILPYIDDTYLLPQTITPTIFMINTTGYNGVYNGNTALKLCNNYYNRLKYWLGGSLRDYLTQYSVTFYIYNKYVTINNNPPPNSYFGNFNANPVYASTEGLMLKLNRLGKVGETITPNNSVRYYAIPITALSVNENPYMIKLYSIYNLERVSGEYCPVTLVRGTSLNGNKPYFKDFIIYDELFRYTGDSIINVNMVNGMETYSNPVICVGLVLLCATSKYAYFYSINQKTIYRFSGSRELDLFKKISQMKNPLYGKFSTVNQKSYIFTGKELVCFDDFNFLYTIPLPNGEPYKLLNTKNNLTISYFDKQEEPLSILIPEYIPSIRKIMEDGWTVQPDKTRKYHKEPDGIIYNPSYAKTNYYPIDKPDMDIQIQQWQVELYLSPTMRSINEGFTQRVYLRTHSIFENGASVSDWDVHHIDNKMFQAGDRLTLQHVPNTNTVYRQAIEIYSDDLVCVSALYLYYEGVTNNRKFIFKVPLQDVNLPYRSNSFMDAQVS